MKKKLFLTALCTIGLSLILACRMDIDTTTASIARNLDGDLVETPDTNETESDDFSEQFYLNQERSLSILDEAMNPFRIAYDPETGEGSNIYNEAFAGVFIDDEGNLNIGVIQGAVTEQIEISINNLRGQVIYRYDSFSYNFLSNFC